MHQNALENAQRDGYMSIHPQVDMTSPMICNMKRMHHKTPTASKIALDATAMRATSQRTRHVDIQVEARWRCCKSQTTQYGRYEWQSTDVPRPSNPEWTKLQPGMSVRWTGYHVHTAVPGPICASRERRMRSSGLERQGEFPYGVIWRRDA